MDKSLTYADAGVDIDKANTFVKTVKKIARETHRSGASGGAMGEIGGFGGLFSIIVDGMDMPVLVSSTDGVGTKLKIACMTHKHDTIGVDLVAMCINDIIVQGAKPLFFLDYLSMGKFDTGVATDIIKGIADGCRQAGCALIGGETAEMPGYYPENEYDLAGFAVGIVENSKIIDGSEIHVNNKLIGIASSGLHSNGYSLVRKICFEKLKLDIDSHIHELGCTLGEELLKPTKIYAETVYRLKRDLPILGLAHITGGGLVDNILRILPKACRVIMRKKEWDSPPIFSYLQKAGNISDPEMMRTFNNGIGLVAIVPETAAEDVMERLRAMQENAFIIGEIVERKGSETQVIWT